MTASHFIDPDAAVLLARAPLPRRALFLDRDGVINVDHGYVHRPEHTEWISGIFDLCHSACDLGYLLVVVTNQAGIARGYYDEKQFAAYTRWAHGQFRRRGLGILATYHCPHHPTNGLNTLRIECNCRKPKPGMILDAQRDFDLDLSRSMLIGDKASDLEAGLSAGVGKMFQLGDATAGTIRTTMVDAIDWLNRESIQ